MSGIRVLGPSLDSQQTNETGISISRCIDIEISNMEFAGWGSAAIEIVDQEDDATQDRGSITLGPDGTPDGGRIRDPQQVRIIRNYFHHNQHPSEGGHAAGYGVNVQDGAWALVAENVFDFNRHAIAASGKAGGYDAERNLILKGGGFHGRWYNRWTHLFDVHGDAHGFLSSAGTSLKNTLCFWCEDKPPSTYDTGNAGRRFLFVANAFQFRNDYAIKIRGRPRSAAIIQQNVFPHDGLEADWGDDAISLQTKENVDLGPGNVIRVDTFGKYGVCDFDGDGVDDLFLPTGRTWWFSSFGEFQWSYLNARTERLAALRLGYFDDDGRCDVLTESNGRWEISSGGSGLKTSLGIFDARLQDVQFGRFDPRVRDSRPNVTRKTTHAFRRLPDGQWQVTSLSARDWQNVETSQLPMNKLRFGDFTGDGVTDVLAVVDGQWSISESAREPWRPLNPNLDEPMAKLQIVNLDADDNIDDVLRLDVTGTPSSLFLSTATTRLTWWRSKNGTEPWREYKKYEFKYEVSAGFTITPQFGFAGRFGVTPGGGVMVIDQNRRGRFFSHVDEPSDWMSRFAY
jgi:hypothetical protein